MDSLPIPGGNTDLDLNPTKISTSPLSLENNLLAPHLQKRYTTISIPSTYGRQNSSPPPGTVAGIVIGSVGAVVLVFYLTFLALNPGGLARGSSSFTDEEDVVVRSRRPPSSRRRGSEVIEIVEERSRGPRDSYRRRPSRRGGDRVVVEESESGMTATATATATTEDDRDAVEVIEEESSGVSSASPAPRRARSHRSGVRTVDPDDYGGGSSYGSRYR